MHFFVISLLIPQTIHTVMAFLEVQFAGIRRKIAMQEGAGGAGASPRRLQREDYYTTDYHLFNMVRN